ncbi:hypothetical protein D3C71_2091650 [compost metagenome]
MGGLADCKNYTSTQKGHAAVTRDMAFLGIEARSVEYEAFRMDFSTHCMKHTARSTKHTAASMKYAS